MFTKMCQKSTRGIIRFQPTPIISILFELLVSLIFVLGLAYTAEIPSSSIRFNSLMDNQNQGFYRDIFPSEFKWGLGSSAFQVEGAWEEDGKGESIWDRFCHDNPKNVEDESNANVSCDTYHKSLEDVKLIKSIGAKVYRFSISWPRVLPKGTIEVVNKIGLAYYDNLINELIANGIEPMICLFHWDLPQHLQESGGWLNEQNIGIFGDYSRLIYKTFGDKVKYWITINEPYTYCYYGYDQGKFAPGVLDPATGPYECVHSLIKAHALAYHIYKEEFSIKQKGKVGISLDNFWQEPADPKSKDDIRAAEQSYVFRFDWVAYPLFFGEYPPIMRKIIDAKSKEEKRKVSRLPTFDADWTKNINGSLDFLGINHFTTQLVSFSNTTPATPNWKSDSGTIRFYDPQWPSTGSRWLKMVPYGLRKALNRIKKDFGNPEVIITENGVSDQSSKLQDSINDNQRVEYHKLYINEVLKAVKLDGCNVTGYIGWGFMDAFEWTQGYTEKFGIFHVDHKNPNRTRTPKKSAGMLKKIFQQNGFPAQISVIVVPAHQEYRDQSSSKYSISPMIILYSAPLALVCSAYYAYTH